MMDEVRFGLLGYGGWGSHHAAAIQNTDGARLVAITSRSDETRERAALAHPEVEINEDLHEFLGREDLDVVCVALPNDFHFPAAKLVLEAGHHLLLEKPMALEVEQCNELIDLAASKQKRLMIGHELRLSTLWGQMKTLVDQGAIGEPRYMNVNVWRRPLRDGVDGWRHDAGRVGSWAFEEPIHFFDLVRWYFEAAGDPKSIYARGNARPQDGGGLCDNFTAVVSFAEDAYAVVSYSASAFEHYQSIQITGRRGSMWGTCSAAHERTWQANSSLKIERNGQAETVELGGPSGELFELREEMAMVVDVMRGRSRPVVSGHDGRWAVAMCKAAEASLASGRAEPIRQCEPRREDDDLLIYTPRRRRAQRSVPAPRPPHGPTLPN